MGIQISYEDATELIRLFAGRFDPEKKKKPTKYTVLFINLDLSRIL